MFNAVEQAVKTHIGIRRGTITLSQKKRRKNRSWNPVLPSLSVSETGSISATEIKLFIMHDENFRIV